MFLSTFEKQLDAKRRIVLPAEFRAALAGAAEVHLFQSIRSDCIEGGGDVLIQRYEAMADELEFGDELRDSIERQVFGDGLRLAFDSAGRITLPEALCAEYGFDDWVVLIGMRDRFEIWEREAYRANRAPDREFARKGLADMRERQRAARLGGLA